MQYFAAFTLILSWSANRLSCTSLNGSISPWPMGPVAKLEVSPQIVSGLGQKVILRRKNEPLNMTCTAVYQNSEKNDTPLSDYIVDWKVPFHINNRATRVERGQGPNVAWLWFERLAEKDAGDYRCMAISFNSVRQPSLSINIHLSVKHKIMYCGSRWFRCHSSLCIMTRYVCDGKRDCEDGEDESAAAGCGPDPCVGKVICDQRCIPRDWCCDQHNCSSSSHLTHPEPPIDHPYFSDIGFLQTTIYTIIGCATAFMFIVTILVIAICRVQMKRAMNSRCSQQMRIACSQPRHNMPLYDLDVYLNRNTDLNHSGGVSVMYNINSGVQFMGRLVEPPPYSEVASIPPREGPPPPYVSCEHLLEPSVEVDLNLNVSSHENCEISAINQIANDNDDDSTVRVVSSVQNNASFPNTQCFSTGQIPGPQVQPGFEIFNFNMNSDNTSNTTFNVFDGTALNASSNSDTSSSSSVNNFVFDRNITSHSQNFEPEYIETDSLLTENRNNSESQDIDSRNTEDCYTYLESQRLDQSQHVGASNVHRYWYEVNRNTSRNEGRSKGFNLGNSENEGTFLEIEQQSDSDVTSNQNFETAESLPLFGNINSPSNISLRDVHLNPSCSTVAVNDTDINLVIADQDVMKTDSTNCNLKLNLLTGVVEEGLEKKIANVSSAVQTDECLDENAHRSGTRDISLSRENLCVCEDSAICYDRDQASSSNKDEEESLLPRVGDNFIKSNSSLTFCANDVLNGDTEVIDDKPDTPVHEMQSLVLPLRESFIGVRKES